LLAHADAHPEAEPELEASASETGQSPLHGDPARHRPIHTGGEHREDSVAGGFDLAAPVGGERLAKDRIALAWCRWQLSLLLLPRRVAVETSRASSDDKGTVWTGGSTITYLSGQVDL
jgi:hypothetical protein